MEELQRNPPKWSVLLPIPPPPPTAGGAEDQTANVDEEDSVMAGARRAIDYLEASLNPRGIREAHLRKSISQLRPILIAAVAACPRDILAVSEEEKEDIKPTKLVMEIT